MIYNEDCLEGMKRIETGSVDAIICDLPYNLTGCAWDKSAIDLAELWTQFRRVLKPCCSAVLFASGRFTHKLIASNFDWYKYKWIWVKNAPTMFAHAKNAPMRRFEEILVFSDGAINHASCSKRRMKYNPQGVVPCCKVFKVNSKKQSEVTAYGGKLRGNSEHNTYGDRPSQPYIRTNEGGNRLHWRRNGGRFGSTIGERPSRVEGSYYLQEQTGYPSDVLSFDVEPNGKRLHPTQKPVALLEYLIKTYTNEGEVVLDATMGSGSTGVAAVNTRRNFIGFEKEQHFFEIAQRRIDEALAAKAQELF